MADMKRHHRRRANWAFLRFSEGTRARAPSIWHATGIAGSSMSK